MDAGLGIVDAVQLLRDLDRTHREREGIEEEESVPQLEIDASWTKQEGIKSLEFSPDGRLLAAVTDGGQLHVYDAQTLRQGKPERWTWNEEDSVNQTNVEKIQWRPEAKEGDPGKFRFLALNEQGQLYVGQVGDHDFQELASREEMAIVAFSWSPCGNFICYGNKKTVNVVSMEDLSKPLIQWEVSTWQLPEVDMDNICWVESNLILVAFYEVGEGANDCPLVAVSWNGVASAVEGLAAAKHKIMEDVFPCIEWEYAREVPHPWFEAAATEKKELSLSAHRLAYDGHVALMKKSGEEWQIAEIEDDRLLLRIPLTSDEEDNLVLDMAVDFASKAATRASITCEDPRDVSKPALPAVGFVVFLTKDHVIRAYSMTNLELSGQEALPHLPPLPTLVPFDFSKLSPSVSTREHEEALGESFTEEQKVDKASASQASADQSTPKFPAPTTAVVSHEPTSASKLQAQNVFPKTVSKENNVPVERATTTKHKASSEATRIKETSLAVGEAGFEAVFEEGSEAELQFQRGLQETRTLQQEVSDMLLHSVQRSGVGTNSCFLSFQEVGELFKRSSVLLEEVGCLKIEELKCEAMKKRLKENIRATVAALEELKSLQKRNKVLLLDENRPLDGDLSRAWGELSEQYYSLVTNISWFEHHLSNAEMTLRSRKTVNEVTARCWKHSLFSENELVGFNEGNRSSQKVSMEIKSLYSTLHSQQELLQVQNAKLDSLVSRAREEWEKLEHASEAGTKAYLGDASRLSLSDDQHELNSKPCSMPESPGIDASCIDGQSLVGDQIRQALSKTRISGGSSLIIDPFNNQKNTTDTGVGTGTNLVKDLVQSSTVFTLEGAEEILSDIRNAHSVLEKYPRKHTRRLAKPLNPEATMKKSPETSFTRSALSKPYGADETKSSTQQHRNLNDAPKLERTDDQASREQREPVTTKQDLSTVEDKFGGLLRSSDTFSKHTTSSTKPLATSKTASSTLDTMKDEDKNIAALQPNIPTSDTSKKTSLAKQDEKASEGTLAEPLQTSSFNPTATKVGFGTSGLCGNNASTPMKQETTEPSKQLSKSTTTTSSAAPSASWASTFTNVPNRGSTFAHTPTGTAIQATVSSTPSTSGQEAPSQTAAVASSTQGMTSQASFGLSAQPSLPTAFDPAGTVPGQANFGRASGFGSSASISHAEPMGAFGGVSSPFTGSGTALTPQASAPASPFTSTPSSSQGQVASGFGAAPQLGTGGQSRSPFGAGFGAPSQTAGSFGSPPMPASSTFQPSSQTPGTSTASKFGGGFGAAPQIGGGFGTPPQLSGAFGAPAQPTSPFGASAQSGSGFGNPGQATSGFSTPAQPGSGFGNLAQQNSGWGAPAQPPFGGGGGAQTAGGAFGGGNQAGGGGFAAFASQSSGFGSVTQPGFGNQVSPPPTAQMGGFGQAQAPFGTPSVPAAAKFTQMRR